MIVVVTRHLGAVEWLIRHEIIPNDANEVSVIDHATPEDVTGQVCTAYCRCTLPLWQRKSTVSTSPTYPLTSVVRN